MKPGIVFAIGFSMLLLAGGQAYAGSPASTGSSAGILLAQSTTTKKKAATQHKTRTVCEDVTVQDEPKDKNQIAGMAVGAVAGGLLGNQVGGGKGRTLATVAGAVGGGYAGKKIQENQQSKNTHVERRCRQVTD
jgi:uncharacterized protein YcfJ